MAADVMASIVDLGLKDLGNFFLLPWAPDRNLA